MLIYQRDGTYQFMSLVNASSEDEALDKAVRAVDRWNDALRWIGSYELVEVFKADKQVEVSSTLARIEQLKLLKGAK